MRVISGKVRGLTLKTIQSDSTRPTRDMVREALFSILINQIPGCSFLDLFAGSGAVGIEALSRGAAFAMFIDNNPQCTQMIRENIAKARMTECAEVYHTDYQKALNKIKEHSFDIIFIDPPYHHEMGIDAIQRISNQNLLKEDGIIVWETDTDEVVPDEIGKFTKFNYKRYGRNRLSFFKRKE